MEVTFNIIANPETFEICKRIREKVFCEEQGFVVELDDTDLCASHLLMYVDGVPVGVARTYFEDLEHEKKDSRTIGRVCVLPEYRGKNLGAQLLKGVEESFPAKEYILHSQLARSGFYEKCGYTKCAEIDYEEGVPHVWMKKELR